MAVDSLAAYLGSTLQATDMGPSLFELGFDLYSMLTFWYGLSPDEIASLPRNIKSKYVEDLPGLLYQYQMMQIVAASFPNMTEKGRSDVLRSLTPTGKSEAKRRGRLRLVEEENYEEERETAARLDDARVSRSYEPSDGVDQPRDFYEFKRALKDTSVTFVLEEGRRMWQGTEEERQAMIERGELE